MKQAFRLLIIGCFLFISSQARALEIVDLTGGGPYTAKISNHAINRIALPYPAKEIVTQKDAPVDAKLMGKNLFLSMVRPDYAGTVEIYILFDAHDPIGMTLQPVGISGETILVKTPYASSEKAVKWEQSLAYEKTIKELVRKMASDDVPDGYTVEEGNTQDISPWKEASIQRQRSYRGATFVGEIYSVLNASPETMTLEEDELASSLLGSNIKAVSIQNRNLESGKQTLVYVIRGNAFGGPHGK
jgi:hypothetical protein